MTLTPRDRALLAVAVAIALVGVFYLVGYKPQVHRADALETSIATARTQLTTVENRYATGRAAEGRLAATRSEYAAAGRAVPRQSDIPGLLRLLQHTADAAHVSIQSITLSGSSSSGGAASTAGSATPTAADGAETVPVSLTLGGGFQALNRMVGRLNDLVVVSHGHLRAGGPLISVGDVSLNTGTSGSTLSISLSATIYQHAGATSAPGTTSEGSS